MVFLATVSLLVLGDDTDGVLNTLLWLSGMLSTSKDAASRVGFCERGVKARNVATRAKITSSATMAFG